MMASLHTITVKYRLQRTYGPMYRFCFNACLAAVAVGTALGVAAVWVPEEWHLIGAKLAWTDAVLFISAVVGALLCKVGV